MAVAMPESTSLQRSQTMVIHSLENGENGGMRLKKIITEMTVPGMIGTRETINMTDVIKVEVGAVMSGVDHITTNLKGTASQKTSLSDSEVLYPPPNLIQGKSHMSLLTTKM